MSLLNSLKWDILIEETGFCIVSHNNEYSKRILTTDKNFEPHERQLGELLGYPACCAKHCSNIGESNIDVYAKEFAHNAHEQNIELLNIRHYEQGFSLISHIPCSYHCQTSINMAKESLSQLLKQPNRGKIHQWRTQVLGCLKLLH